MLRAPHVIVPLLPGQRGTETGETPGQGPQGAETLDSVANGDHRPNLSLY